MKKGFDEAVALLQGLDPEAQKRILQQISLQDPQMAKRLESNLIQLQDLKSLTPAMIVELLKAFSLERLALALKTTETALHEHFLGQLSKNNQEEFKAVLNRPRSLSDVLKAQEELIQVVRALIAKGKILLSQDKNDRWV